MYVPIILGTARRGRQSEKVARFVLEETVNNGMESDIIDVKDFRIDATDNSEESLQAKRLSEKIARADGFIIVTPEYNHSYPGELKMMLDMLYEQYAKKPVGICGVSSGPMGGSRAVEQLRLVCIEFHMLPIRESLYFPMVEDLFDANDKIKDRSFSKRAKKFLEELAWHAKALKNSREKSN
jgi:NAD(P)H-dependent FMN reductase